MYNKSIIIIFIFLSTNLQSQNCNNVITSTIPYNSQYATGGFNIYPRNGANANINQLLKPIIIVEGFDARNDYSCSNIHSLVNRQPYWLANQLKNQGYDIVILNFDDGGDYIQKNAFLLLELINLINNNKLDSNQELVVIGFSMGGLVARYCLTYMEENALDHQTRLFISYDSPHQGANIPLSIQSMLTGINSNLGIYALLVPELQSRYDEIMSPAAQQMMIYHTSSTSPSPGSANSSTFFTKFFTELENLNQCNGYPQQCRNVGISLGNADGTPLTQDDGSTIVPGGVALDFSWIYQNTNWIGLGQSGYACVIPSQSWPGVPANYPNASFLYQLNGVVNSFVALNTQSQQPVDIVPGSYLPVFEDVHDAITSTNDIGNVTSNLNVEKATMIPTISALDLSVSDYFYDIQNDPNIHLKTPFEEIFHLGSYRESHVRPARDINEIQFIVNQINNLSGPSCHSLNDNVTLNNIVINNNQQNNTTYKGKITANNFTINNGGTAKFEATNKIELKPGFKALPGASFDARIICINKSCTQ